MQSLTDLLLNQKSDGLSLAAISIDINRPSTSSGPPKTVNLVGHQMIPREPKCFPSRYDATASRGNQDGQVRCTIPKIKTLNIFSLKRRKKIAVSPIRRALNRRGTEPGTRFYSGEQEATVLRIVLGTQLHKEYQ